MNYKTNISFGDTVRIISTDLTKKFNINDKIGQVYGETIPSITNVKVIGNNNDDFAFNIQIDDCNEYWISPDLLEFINHTSGTEINIGSYSATRTVSGEWKENRKKWWKFWAK
ncbi:MAG: hypothetical protein JXM74_10410 [Fusobacteriaceae bacterium]|nr:hypothetical protein [Fusobacteriaceae bacterium]MBN2839154.1 hypothetical protein [Fusobacteriaceae bacterium]